MAAIAGHYAYADYSVSLQNGRILHLADLGAASARLDIAEPSTLTLRMTMQSGQVVYQTAKIIEAHFANRSGYWLAQWPDMTYPVRAQASITGTALTSTTKFDNPSDPDRFGSVESAIMIKAHTP